MPTFSDKIVRTYPDNYNPDTMAREPALQPSAGAGGGGDASAANQTTGNASLASIDGKLTNPLPVSGTFFQATQPVSGTFFQATQPVSLASVPSHAVTNAGTFSVQVSSAPTTAVTGTFFQVTQPVSGTVTTTPPANASTNVAQVAGTAADVNSGTKSAGTLRVVLATDQPALTNKLLVTPDSVALPANQSVNTAQVAGATTVTSATGVQKVGVVGNAGAIFDAATGAAVPANGLYAGLRAATANPSNATGANLVGAMGDHAGRQVVTLGHVRELIGIQQAAVAATSETTIVTAGGAGVFNDLIGLIVTTAGAAAQTITVKDATAGTTRFVFNYPNAALAPGSPFLFFPTVAIPQAAANANWTVTQSVATGCNYTAIFLKNT